MLAGLFEIEIKSGKACEVIGCERSPTRTHPMPAPNPMRSSVGTTSSTLSSCSLPGSKAVEQSSDSGGLSAGFDVEAAEGFADHLDLSMDLTDAFLAIGEAAKEREKGVVLLLDEAQFLSKLQLEALIAALHKVVQRNLPITMVGAGLPQVAELAGDAKSYAERLFKFPAISNLPRPDADEALVKPAQPVHVSYDASALAEAYSITGGYPYFIQELGYAVWTIAGGSRITIEDIRSAVPGYVAKLDSSFFRVRLDRASELQRSYLRAMAGLGPAPQKASDVADAMGRSSTNLGPTRAELINMGLLCTPEHGYAAFTVPHFDRFMIRAVPTLQVPRVRTRGRR